MITLIRKHWIPITLFVAVYVISVIPCLFMRAPMAWADEYSTMATAHYFSGGPYWYIKGAAYHGYENGLVFSVLFWLFDDISVIYTAALTITALAVAVIPVLCYRLLGEVLRLESRLHRAGISLAITLFPIFRYTQNTYVMRPACFASCSCAYT